MYLDDIMLFKKFPKKEQNTLVIWFNNLEGLSKGKITFSVSNYLQTATLFPASFIRCGTTLFLCFFKIAIFSR